MTPKSASELSVRRAAEALVLSYGREAYVSVLHSTRNGTAMTSVMIQQATWVNTATTRLID